MLCCFALGLDLSIYGNLLSGEQTSTKLLPKSSTHTQVGLLNKDIVEQSISDCYQMHRETVK